jgi:hypothetical protein
MSLPDKFGFQNLKRTEVALFEPPPFKASADVVVFTGSAHPIYEGETGQLKRCTCIREAYFKPPQTPVYYYNLWTANLSYGFLF